MERRLTTRYNPEQLPGIMSTVLLVLPDGFGIESQLVDISSQGLKLSIPPMSIPLSIPRKAEIVEVVFHDLHLTCRCIYSAYNPDGSICMGMYVFDPLQQDQLRGILNGCG